METTSVSVDALRGGNSPYMVVFVNTLSVVGTARVSSLARLSRDTLDRDRHRVDVASLRGGKLAAVAIRFVIIQDVRVVYIGRSFLVMRHVLCHRYSPIYLRFGVSEISPAR